MNSQFNAIDYAQQLEAAGVPQSQAEVHAKTLSLAFSTCAASRSDLKALDDKLATRLDLFEERITGRMDAFEAKITARMDAFEAKITARMDAYEARITARIDAFESSVKLELAGMHTEIVAMNQTLKFHKWMFGINYTMLIALIVKAYFP
jgi:hypothetical protein